MKLLSFVLVPHRRSCEGGMCKVLKEFTFHNDRGDTEDVIVIAFGCDYKCDIPSIVYNIVFNYMQKPATEANVETAAWSSWCAKLLTDNPDGRIISEYMANVINSRCGISVERSKMLYLPSADGNWSVFKSSVRQQMR